MKGTWRIKNVKRVSVKPEKHREIFKYFRNISWNISRNISGPKMSWNFTSLLLILPSQTSCYIRECIGDSRSEFNIILCTSKSESAVTSNKKLRCRYVEADYRKTRSIARPLCAILRHKTRTCQTPSHRDRQTPHKIQNTNINLRRLLYVIAICFECEEMTEIRGNVIESSRCRSCRLPAVSEWPMYQHFNCGVANLAILRKHSIAACWTDARRILRDNKNL